MWGALCRSPHAQLMFRRLWGGIIFERKQLEDLTELCKRAHEEGRTPTLLGVQARMHVVKCAHVCMRVVCVCVWHGGGTAEGGRRPQ